MKGAGTEPAALGKVVVTGGLGFIGSHLVDKLLLDGNEVVVVDDCSSGSEENVSAHLKARGFKLSKTDIRDTDTLARLFRDVNAVVHLAALVSVRRSVDDPDAVFLVNVGGTKAVLDACRKCCVPNIVFASTAAVYGSPKRLPVTEESPTRPLSPYAASKVWGEALCQSYSSSYGMNAVSLRFMNVYGTRRSQGPYSGVMVRFAEAVRSGTAITVNGDGHQKRDFVHVSDVVSAVCLALRKDLGGEIFNIGTGIPTSINDLATLFQVAAGSQCPVTHAAPLPGEVRDSYADISKSQDLLRYVPRVDLTEGVEGYLRWFSEKGRHSN